MSKQDYFSSDNKRENIMQQILDKMSIYHNCLSYNYLNVIYIYAIVIYSSYLNKILRIMLLIYCISYK